MKTLRNISTLIVLPLAVASVSARAGFLSVSQRSVSDYLFVTPVLTNNIQGKVINPYDPYGVIRSEDRDWFHEAFMEREYLVGGYVHHAKGVGAHITHPNFGVFWNGPVRGRTDSWLDPTVTLGEPKPIDITKLDEPVTNVVYETFMTNGIVESLDVITMPMTNGTTSVFTNKWTAYRLVDSGIMLPKTNVTARSMMDFCIDGGGIFPGYTDTPKMSFGQVAISNGVATLIFIDCPNAGVFSNACEALKGTKRLCDENLHPTNSSSVTILEDVYDNIEDSYTRWDYGGGVCTYEVLTYNDYCRRKYTPPYNAVVPTRFGGYIATTGGVNRVSLEAVYAICGIKYRHEDDFVETANVDTNVVMRVPASITFDTSGPTASIKFSLNAASFCAQAAVVAGCPAAPSTLYSYREDNHGDQSSWSVVLTTLVAFYRITPGTTLPIW